MPDVHDALVIGGGPGGSAAALLLARAGGRVALLERQPFPRRKVCGEYLSATNRPLLRRLGLEEAFCRTAGPPVRRVGLFAGTTVATADLPLPPGEPDGWGQALGREHLDTLLLQQAAAAGVEVLQPWKAVALSEEGGLYRCHAAPVATSSLACGPQARLLVATGGEAELLARVVVAAHGSWERGELPTQTPRQPPRPGDL